MRDFKGMKRQRGRNRGGGGGGGGKPQQHNANRAFDSNGPDGVKVRGNAQHVFEKYQQLARDAGTAGDRVLAENYLQHAEHYFRTLRAMQPQRPASEILGRDQFASGYDLDFEDESGAAQAVDAETSETAAQDNGEASDTDNRNGWQARDDRQPRDRDRDDRPREDRPRNENGRREGRWRDRDDRPREDRPREDRQRDDRPRGERFERDRNEPRPDRDPLAVVEPQATPLVNEDRSGPVLRDADGGESHAPAFLQVRKSAAAPAPEASEDGEPARKPRRRRAPRSFEGGEGAAPPSETEEA